MDFDRSFSSSPTTTHCLSESWAIGKLEKCPWNRRECEIVWAWAWYCAELIDLHFFPLVSAS